MAKKILLFLSTCREESPEYEYRCPDGTMVRGVQSNEAPVKYLLACYPDISEIICIVTEKAKQTAWERFCKEISKENPKIKITDVFCDGEDSEAFVKGPMPKILANVNSGDEIFLDTTGGFRNAVIYMLLISRILSYSGIPVKAAVYSNFQNKEIEDLSETMRLFDLVEGMQEMTSFGSVHSIKQYYEATGKKDGKIEKMLWAVEELTETVSLCRTEALDEKTRQFNDALKEAEKSEDLLFRQMLTAFKKKFGGQWNVISILNWCVESGMVQQALTIYTERIPAYLMQRGMLKLKPQADRNKLYEELKKKKYEDGDAVLFFRGFLNMAQKNDTSQCLADFLNNAGNQENMIYYIRNHRDMKHFFAGDICQNPEIEVGVQNVMYFLRFFYLDYEKINKQTIDQAVEQFKNKYKNLASQVMLKWIESKKNTWPKDIKKMINMLVTENTKILPAFFGITKEGKYEDTNVLTLENMEKLLPDSDYCLQCPYPKMKRIAKDYVYVKQLRNMANHANEKALGEGGELLEYLYKDGYQNLRDTNVKQISEMIKECIKHIEQEDDK